MKRIYCDMDGVLCDFKKKAEQVVGIPITQWAHKSKSEKLYRNKNDIMLIHIN